MVDRNRNRIDDVVELREIAERALAEKDFFVRPPEDARAETERLEVPADAELGAAGRDLTGLPWSSIDNDDSEDLDQLEVAERLDAGVIRVRVAIADVDHFVPKGSAIDRAAGHNTTTVYTAAGVYPMLPRKLSEQMTSLLEAVTRVAW